MALSIKLPIGEPSYTQRVTLEGVEYGLRFDYSAREDRYYLTVQDAAGADLRRGIKVTPNANVLRLYAGASGPPGVVIFVDKRPTDAGGDAPGFADLGVSVTLGYLTEADLAELGVT